ncbi:acyloxyacyl hydrolase [Ferrigenium sp. UT4]
MSRFFLLVFASMLAVPAAAVDGVLVQLGHGDNGTDLVRGGAIWQWNRQWLDEGRWRLTGYWEAAAGQWRSANAAGKNKRFTDVGFTPVFRFEQQSLSAFAPYFEGGIGAHLISPKFSNADRRFSTVFQFGDHIGVGARFGDHHQFDFGYRFQHLSNGSIKQPNPGINFNQINLIYRF